MFLAMAYHNLKGVCPLVGSPALLAEVPTVSSHQGHSGMQGDVPHRLGQLHSLQSPIDARRRKSTHPERISSNSYCFQRGRQLHATQQCCQAPLHPHVGLSGTFWADRMLEASCQSPILRQAARISWYHASLGREPRSPYTCDEFIEKVSFTV